MKTLKEQIAVMQAAEDGADIEAHLLSASRNWKITEPVWDWYLCDYRIAKPKLREFWRNYYDDMFFKTIHASKGTADSAACSGRTECVHFREVLEDDLDTDDSGQTEGGR